MNTNTPADSIVRHGRFYFHHHTPARLRNLALTFQALVRRPIHAPNMPISLKIEPSEMCQLSCPGCIQSNPLYKINSRGKLMSLETYSP
jgi:hypothetical protein